MKTSVYITNQVIMAAVGNDDGRKLNVTGCYRTELPEGLVDSGVVADADALRQQLSDFFKRNNIPRKKINLVLGNDIVMLKTLDAPIIPHARLKQVARNEMGGHRDEENALIYDYAVLKPAPGENGMGRIMAVSADKEVVQRYLDVFAAAKISLGGIDVAQNCASRLCERLSELAGRTFVLAFLIGSEMTSMLFSGNECLIINRIQLYEDRGTPSAAVEISRGLSSMVQFNYTLNAEHPLTNIYLSDLTGEEKQFLGEMVEALGVPVGPLLLPAEITGPYAKLEYPDFGVYFFCLGGLLKA